MFEIFIILVCLLINAILAGSETAFIAVNKSTVRALASQGDEKAKLLLQLRENPERTLSIVQIGITFVGAFAAAIGGAGATGSITPWLMKYYGLRETTAEISSIILVVIPLTYASVVIGELVPKTLALRRSLFLAKWVAPWLHVISRLISPIVSLFEWSTKKIIACFPKAHTISEEMEEVSFDENLSPLNKQYILNMMKIERTTVKEIFVEWKDVVYLDTSQTIEDVEKILISSAHTRLPVLKEGKILGILNSKELFAFLKVGNIQWTSLARPVVSLQESTLILTALHLLQQSHAHMAIVYHGSVRTGMITMETIFEEIIGDIYDEDDDGRITKILASTKRY